MSSKGTQKSLSWYARSTNVAGKSNRKFYNIKDFKEIDEEKNIRKQFCKPQEELVFPLAQTRLKD